MKSYAIIIWSLTLSLTVGLPIDERNNIEIVKKVLDLLKDIKVEDKYMFDVVSREDFVRFAMEFVLEQAAKKYGQDKQNNQSQSGEIIKLQYGYNSWNDSCNYRVLSEMIDCMKGPNSFAFSTNDGNEDDIDNDFGKCLISAFNEYAYCAVAEVANMAGIK